ncbi:MAG: alcohol dehydrogenase [Gammaproteobacteria bacterium]|jgi:uncharacterized zinc-type alcohol dehydrogenase-like protein|nr:alcohol dehydrogenase [Gammaproteobacteria bacterium]
MIKSIGYAAFDALSPLKPYSFDRRALGATDVHIEIAFCGICHSDLHTVRNEWGGAKYPLIPGHEITGHVKAVGSKVKKFKVGDTVGVGCMVNSCGHCTCCKEDLQQFCARGFTATYNSTDAEGKTTQGGYSNHIVVEEKFVLTMPPHLKLENSAPLLCAGITTYSPLRHWKITKGHKVGIIGLGGLGHMGVKFACSFGAHVVVFTTSPHKKADALKLGAHEVVISKNADEMKIHLNTFDFMLDTVSAPHNVENYMSLLKHDGTLCMVGASPEPHQISSSVVIRGRKNLSGSLIGGLAETQEMLDYCGKHHITCDVELIPIQKINLAYERLLKSDVKYRFVIDISSLSHK